MEGIGSTLEDEIKKLPESLETIKNLNSKHNKLRKDYEKLEGVVTELLGRIENYKAVLNSLERSIEVINKTAKEIRESK